MVATQSQDKGKPTVIPTDKGKVQCSQFDTHLQGLGIPYATPPGVHAGLSMMIPKASRLRMAATPLRSNSPQRSAP